MSSPKEDAVGDDDDNLCGGDLGLGRGLKPGGIARIDGDSDSETDFDRRPDWGTAFSEDADRIDGDQQTVVNNCTYDKICSNCKNTSLYVIKCQVCRQEPSRDSSMQQGPPFPNTVQKLKLLTRSKSEAHGHEKQDVSTTDFPSIGEIQLGTSIRQQKQLYEQNRKEIFDLGAEVDPTNSHSLKQQQEKINGNKEDQQNVSELSKKLLTAERDIEILRYELETCKKVSESRCKAMRLFKGHSYAIQSQQIDSAKKTAQLNKTLQAEINQLQFELEYKEASILTSQEMWTGRFQKVSQENEELKTTLHEQTSTIRKLQGEKTALIREQDELLALLDVQERQRYEAARSQSSDDNSDYNNFTSTELAVLGACRCRIRKPQPCGCAHAAAYMKREIAKQRVEMAAERQRAAEATIMADAYRIAFEEQLNRNSGLMRRLVDITSMTCGDSSPHVSKPRAALRWLIKQLNEEDYLPVTLKEGQMVLEARACDEFQSQLCESETTISDRTSEEGSIRGPDTEILKVNGERDICGNGNNLNLESTGVACRQGSNETLNSTPSQPVQEAHQSSPTTNTLWDASLENSVLNDDVEQNKLTLAEGNIKNQPCRSIEGYSESNVLDGNEKMSSGQYDHLLHILEGKRDDELISMLLEMIKDRTEALAHQRLAARMLAKRLTDVEQKLTTFTNDIYDK